MSRLERAHHALVARLAALRVPRIVGEPDGADIRTLADHMIEVADGVDAYMEAIGRDLAANAPAPSTPRCSTGRYLRRSTAMLCLKRTGSPIGSMPIDTISRHPRAPMALMRRCV